MLFNNDLKRNYIKTPVLHFNYLPVRPLLFILIRAGGRFMNDNTLIYFSVQYILLQSW